MKKRGGKEEKGEEGEGPPLSADKRQKWIYHYKATVYYSTKRKSNM